MNKFYLLFIFGLLIFSPLFAKADVLINEIAWMGTANSASDEWMEFYNNGSQNIDLTGWTLGAVDGTPNIALQGIISAKSFFLLERTNDSTIPNIVADLIYTGALSNAGEVLILRNASGVEVDRADGSGGWSVVGGNNTTKETAQRIALGWTTGAPTPKAINVGVAPENSPASVQMNSGSTSTSVSADIRNFTPKFNAKIYGGGNTLTAGVEAEFRGGAEGLSADEAGKARFLWSFGDGSYQDGAIARHTYTRLGSYNVSLNVILEPYSASDYVSVAVVLSKAPVMSEPVKAQKAANDSATNQSGVSVPSESVKQAVGVVSPSDNSAPSENVAEKSLNTASVADAKLGFGGNFWFWFLVSLALGIFGGAGFVLIKFFYWR